MPDKKTIMVMTQTDLRDLLYACQVAVQNTKDELHAYHSEGEIPSNEAYDILSRMIVMVSRIKSNLN